MMKLIDLIVKYMPAGEVPENVNYFAQDSDGIVWGYELKPAPVTHGEGGETEWFEDSDDGDVETLGQFDSLATDAATTVVTLAELMEAYDNAQ